MATSDLPSELNVEVVGPGILPEILAILDEMIQLYNDWECPTFLKLESYSRRTEKSTTARYEPYSTRQSLMDAINNNCPRGCNIIYL